MKMLILSIIHMKIQKIFILAVLDFIATAAALLDEMEAIHPFL